MGTFAQWLSQLITPVAARRNGKGGDGDIAIIQRDARPFRACTVQLRQIVIRTAFGLEIALNAADIIRRGGNGRCVGFRGINVDGDNGWLCGAVACRVE